MVPNYGLSIDQTTKDQSKSIENPKPKTDKVLPEIGESANHSSRNPSVRNTLITNVPHRLDPDLNGKRPGIVHT